MITDIEQPPAWMADGICAQTDPDAFFPENGGSSKPAKRICMRCPVRVTCLTYSLDTEQAYGVWGGVAEQQRNQMLKKREVA